MNSLKIHTKISYVAAFDNYTEFLNNNWSATTPHINLSRPLAIADFGESPMFLFSSVSNSIVLLDFLCLWNLLITLVLIYMVWRHLILVFAVNINGVETGVFTHEIGTEMIIGTVTILCVMILICRVFFNMYKCYKGCRGKSRSEVIIGVMVINGRQHSICLRSKELQRSAPHGASRGVPAPRA
jgi:hypothetical protein